MDASASVINLGASVLSNSNNNSGGQQQQGQKQEEKTALITKSAKAFAVLALTLTPEVVSQVLHVPQGNAYVLWNKLVQRFESKTTASKAHTRDLLHKCKMFRDELFDIYEGRIKQLVMSLEQMGERVSEGELMYVLFNGLPLSYEPLVQTLKVNNKMDFEEACTHIREYQEKLRLQHKQESGHSRDDSGYHTEDYRGYNQRGRSKGNKNNNNNHHNQNQTRSKMYCKICKRNNHSTEKCYRNKNNQGNSHSEQKSTPGSTQANGIQCHKCLQYGHIAIGCRNQKKETLATTNNSGQDQDQANNVTDVKVASQYAYHIVDTVTDTVQSTHDGHTQWIVDSACTSHCTNDITLLTNIQKHKVPIIVKVANNEKVMVYKTGDAVIKDSSTFTLKNVRYSKKFSGNLLSVSKLVKVGATVHLDQHEAKISHKGVLISTAPMIRDLYYINAHSCISTHDDTANTGTEVPSVQVIEIVHPNSKFALLHKRMGHLSADTIQVLRRAQAISDMEVSTQEIEKAKNHVCDGCAYGKSHRQPFKSVSSRPAAEQLLERIHCDLSGPINISDLNENEQQVFNALGQPRYLSLIVDEKSRRLSGKLLRYKSDATQHIMEYIAQAENECDKKVKYFHADGGGEYNNKTLQQFFRTKGIQMELTTKDTPQHNGIVERANRSVFELARSMLHDAGMSTVFWGEAVMTAIRLLNLRPTLHEQHKTPFELWYGRKPSIKHLRVFGCDAFVHVLNDERVKMDAKAIKCIFIGYDTLKPNGYRFFNINTNTVMVRRDAKFNEFSFILNTQVSETQRIQQQQQQWKVLTLALDTVEDTVVQSTQVQAQHQQSEQSQTDKQDHQINNSGYKSDGEVSDSDSDVDGDHTSENTSLDQSEDADTDIEWGEETKRPPTEVKQSAVHSSSQHNTDTQDIKIQASASSSQQVNTQRPHRHPSVYSKSYLYHVMEESISAVSADPASYSEAMSASDSKQWRKAIEEEMKSLLANNTWTLVTAPKGVNVIGNRWVLKKKLNSDGSVERYKARLTAKGYSQREGIDYHETFAPVVKYKSLRVILSLANSLDYELKQLDVVTAFLYAPIKEDVYMAQPEGFETGGAHMVCKLNKTLYGIKQAPHEWNNEINHFIVTVLGFHRCRSDSCVYVKTSKTGKRIIIALFVDDIIPIYHISDEAEWKEYITQLTSKFKITDKGDCQWILGMKVTRDRTNRVLKLDQSLYVEQVLKRFNMLNCKPAPTPEATAHRLSNEHSPTTAEHRAQMQHVPYKEAVGSLLYASIATRPDIAHAVNEVCKYMQNPGDPHWQAVKRILRYLRGSMNKPLVFRSNPIHSGNNTCIITAYTDADWAGDYDTRRSTTGYVVQVNNSTVSWMSKKQATVALSSAEAEYMALAAVAQEVKWIQQLLTELSVIAHINTVVYSDNQAAIAISKNDIHHDRTKHIDIRHHFVRECVQHGIFSIEWISTTQQIADILTKALDRVVYTELCSRVM